MKANKQIRINATLKNKDTELDIHVNVSKENAELDPMIIISCKENNDNLYDEYDKHIPTKNQLKAIMYKRDLYHETERKDDTVYIHAGKTRIIDIYNDLKAGYKLDGKGYKIKE